MTTRAGSERGAALLLAMTLVLMLAAAAGAAALTARMEVLLGGAFRQSTDALVVAEGGLARAVQDLSAVADWTSVLAGASSTFTDGSAAGAKQLPGGDVVVLCCGAASLTSDLQQRGHGGVRWGPNTPEWRMFAWGPSSRWLPSARSSTPFYVVVWVADDVEDGDGDPLTDRNGIIIVHALALGPNRARRSIQALARHPLRADGTRLGRGVSIVTTRESRW